MLYLNEHLGGIFARWLAGGRHFYNLSKSLLGKMYAALQCVTGIDGYLLTIHHFLVINL